MSAQPIVPDPTTGAPVPMEEPSGRGNFTAAPGHRVSDARRRYAGAAAPPATLDQAPSVNQTECVDVAAFDQSGYNQLGILAASFADAQSVRIRIENRLRSGTIPPDVAADVLGAAKASEALLGRAMRKAFRRVAPDVYAWQQAMPGVGEHLVARLLGVIGHPVVAQPHHWQPTGQAGSDAQHGGAGGCQDHRDGTGQYASDARSSIAGPSRVLVADPPFMRNVQKLWSYCGHGDPARRRRQGMTADEGAELGSPDAKMLVRLIASKATMEPGRKVSALFAGEQDPDEALRPYRQVYELARLQYREREDWSDKRRDNAALRRVGKRMLRDLWLAARPGIDRASPGRN